MFLMFSFSCAGLNDSCVGIHVCVCVCLCWQVFVCCCACLGVSVCGVRMGVRVDSVLCLCKIQKRYGG